MRAMLGALMLVCCLSLGCDDDSGKSGNQDLSMKVNVDMTVASGTKTCGQVLICASGCAGMAACLQACGESGTTAAQMKYTAIGTCAITGCLAAPDGGGAAPCSGVTDVSTGCQDCITAYAQSAACATQLTACETDQ